METQRETQRDVDSGRAIRIVKKKRKKGRGLVRDRKRKKRKKTKRDTIPQERKMKTKNKRQGAVRLTGPVKTILRLWCKADGCSGCSKDQQQTDRRHVQIGNPRTGRKK